MLLQTGKRLPSPACCPLRRALLRRELALFPDWYLAQHRAIALDDKQQATLASAFDAIVAHNLAAPPASMCTATS